MKRSVPWLGILLASYLGKAQWMQTNGPLGGGNITALFVLGDTVVAGTPESGVFISTNSGVTWDQAGYDFSSFGPNQFFLAGDYILAGTDAGIYRSSDGGFTSEDANIGMPSYRPVVAMTFTGTLVIAATGRGSYFVSADNGGTWEGVSLTQPGPEALAVIGDFTFAGTSTGILRSPDNGLTWTVVNNGLIDLGVQALAAIGEGLFNIPVACFDVRGMDVFAGPDGGGVFVHSTLLTDTEYHESMLPGVKFFPILRPRALPCKGQALIWIRTSRSMLLAANTYSIFPSRAIHAMRTSVNYLRAHMCLNSRKEPPAILSN